MRLVVLRQHKGADRQDAGDGKRHAQRGEAACPHPDRDHETGGIGRVAFGVGEEVVEVKGQALAHRTGSGCGQDVDEIGMVPGRHGIGDDQPADRQPG